MAAFRLSRDAKVAVAVSGGSDSMALARLLGAWAGDNATTLHVLTVDHCLREAGAEEAKQVAAWCAEAGLLHTTLRWDEGAALRGQPRSFQSEAREARYKLLTTWCAANACTHLFVGHHADDQIETFLLRLSRGSGVDGLAAMASAVARDGIVIARPLLGFSKAELTDYCREIGQGWVEDPSNENTASARVRFRQARGILAREGLTDDRLLATIGHLQRARAALDHAVWALLSSACVWDELGVATLHIRSLASAPDEIGLRALSRILMGASGQVYGPRFEGLERVFHTLKSGPWHDATLHGAVLERDGDVLRVFRESAAIASAMECDGASFVCDGRFRITLSCVENQDLPTVSALTPALWREIAEGAKGSLAAAAPARVRATLPAIVDREGLLAVPHAAYLRPNGTTLSLGRVDVACISAAHTMCGAEL